MNHEAPTPVPANNNEVISELNITEARSQISMMRDTLNATGTASPEIISKLTHLIIDVGSEKIKPGVAVEQAQKIVDARPDHQ